MESKISRKRVPENVEKMAEEKESKMSNENASLRGDLKKVTKQRDDLQNIIDNAEMQVKKDGIEMEELRQQCAVALHDLERYKKLYQFYLTKFEDTILGL